ncbi:hypothetical protein ACTI_50520 [Actinoplanes sp. OR16]|nr:hypothetical protein ACTI_50520 [Actinoplanes sp. OR16]
MPAARPPWRVLAITTAVTAGITAVVTLVISGVGPLWRTVFPETPVVVHVDPRRPPLPAPESSAAGGSRPPVAPRGVRAVPEPDDIWYPRAWALPAGADPATMPRTSWRYDDPDPDPEATVTAWISRAGGADIGSTRLRLTVTGQDKDVVIDGLCARLTGPRTAPLTGALLYMPPEGDPPEPASLNLDSGRPCAPELSGAPVHVEAHKNTVIDVEATTRTHTVTWYPELYVVADGRRSVIPVEPERPCRTTALLGDLTAYDTYFEFVAGDSGTRLLPGLPDPGDIEEIREITYGVYQ